MLPSTSNNLVASVMAIRPVSVALARPKDAPAAALAAAATPNTTTRIKELGERLQCFLLKLFLLLLSLSLLLFLFIRVPNRKMIGKRNMTNTEDQVCHYGSSDSFLLQPSGPTVHMTPSPPIPTYTSGGYGTLDDFYTI